MKKGYALLASLMTVSGLAACSTSEKDSKNNDTSADGKLKQELKLMSISDIPTLDTSLATDMVAFNVMNQTMEGLYMLDDKDKATPGVAIGEPEKSKDGKTWTIKLREDAKWSNGDPVTADDFVYSWRRTLNPATGAEYAYIMYDVKNAEDVNLGKKKPEELGVKALDAHTLQIELNTNVPYFQELLAFGTFYPQNQKFVEKEGNNYGVTADSTLYNGPFILSEWNVEKNYVLTPNKHYWDKDKVKLKKIDYQVVKDQQTAANLYSTGSLDITQLAAEQVSKYKNEKGFDAQLEARTYFMRFNQDKVPDLKNKNLRLALAKSFDKASYVHTLLNNGSKATDVLTPAEFVSGPDGKDYVEGVKSPLNYDKEEAKKYYEQAKKELGKDSFSFEYLTYDQDTAKKDAEYVKEQIETNLPGVKLTIKQQPFKQKLKLEADQNYEISFGRWGADYPDPMTYVDLFLTDATNNETGWSNKEFDQLVHDSKGKLLDNPEKRWTSLQQAETILLEDAAIAPVYQSGMARLVNPKIKGMVLHKFAGDTSLKEAYLEE
ncbi:peptide ABC transporter substrate-binding protein [Macrococcus hajekii]|uniref:Peptide ABC transporter substrate-binding protein n=1 Tax=Macrococcus hajekii TaxID=198482 RepID=A0A4R6BJ20_9STAP|nr:peptide ABC transporter substrate-binding protein [Macrococcus hajekii]TDM01598.1 peptide ABC transporter substrate-binding protein [Macrococcus hajekii]GGB01356.1 peptide ABC transporter substrate-binding protein [Macrococcus hajekii]